MKRMLAWWVMGGGLVVGALGQDRMNVLFIVSDDYRVVPARANRPPVLTPNLDRLAARGVRFERAYCQYPVCNPSRVSFLTSLRPEQTGIVKNDTPLRSRLPDVVTLPQRLRQAGWYAASFGKIFHGSQRGDARFDAWVDRAHSWDEAETFGFSPAARTIEGRNLTGGKLAWCRWASTEGADDDHPDGQTASNAVRAMERLSSEGRPWFIGAGFLRPHDPFIAPKKYFDLHPPESLRLYRDPDGITPAPPLALPPGFKAAFDAFTDVERMEFLRAYYASVSFMDAQVGRLMDAMDRLALWDRTLVIFVSDHGYHHNERNWWNKNTLFDRSCLVPMIVCAPDARAGTAAAGLVELIDLYPTVADYCGVSMPHATSGATLRPLLQTPARPGKPAAFTFVARGGGLYGQSVRTDRWRYTRWTDGNDELYDHEADPEETRNRFGAPGHDDIVRRHRELLDELGPVVPLDGPGPGKPSTKPE